ncbi:MAG TPA: hypothetical protein VFY43_04125 [Candidatus Limnocylindria bacterium]|nr:hypothetical protein [Candidatus Limnocylindria bacterium]
MGNLSSSDRTIAISAGLVVIFALYALINAWGGLMVVPLLAALAALVILFLPAIAPNTKAPGSKGSLLMVSGVLAALFWLLAALTWLGWIFDHLGALDTWLFLIGFAVSLWFGYTCWSAFQAEGGKFQFGNTDMSGTAAGSSAAAATSAAPPAEAPAAPPPAAPPPAAPPASTPPPAAPSSDTGMSSPPPGDTSSSGDGGTTG